MNKNKIISLSKKAYSEAKTAVTKKIGGALVTLNGVYITNGYWAFSLLGDYREVSEIIRVPFPEEYPCEALKKVFEDFGITGTKSLNVKNLDLTKTTVQIGNFWFNTKYIKLGIDILGKTAKALVEEKEYGSYIKFTDNKDNQMIILSLKKGCKEL